LAFPSYRSVSSVGVSVGLPLTVVEYFVFYSSVGTSDGMPLVLVDCWSSHRLITFFITFVVVVDIAFSLKHFVAFVEIMLLYCIVIFMRTMSRSPCSKKMSFSIDSNIFFMPLPTFSGF